ncbi:macrophage erythroblast attacher [Nematocida sp. AWRm80]|nr:macrophage erythroblast attacher [Nematocida sp. AWRm80]
MFTISKEDSSHKKNIYKILNREEQLHKLIKSTYLSSNKFCSSLINLSQDQLSYKIEALVQYLKKKQEECKTLETLIRQESLAKEQYLENETTIQIIDYLGRKGMIKTIQSITKELGLHQLIDISPYLQAKQSIEQIKHSPKTHPKEKTEDISVEKVINRLKVCWRFSRLVLESREKALEYCKKNKEEIIQKHLPLLVLPVNSVPFQTLIEECTEKKLSLLFSSEILKVTLGHLEPLLYRRISLGIAGFVTPACKEKDFSTCPGCFSQAVKLSKMLPTSMRNTTTVICSLTKKVIPNGSSILTDQSGKVFQQLAVLPVHSSIGDQGYTHLKRCYFV